MEQQINNNSDPSLLAKKAFKWIVGCLIWAALWLVITFNIKPPIDTNSVAYLVLIIIAIGPTSALIAFGMHLGVIGRFGGSSAPVKSLAGLKFISNPALAQQISEIRYKQYRANTKKFSGWWVFLMIIFLLMAFIFGLTPYASPVSTIFVLPQSRL